MCERMIQRPFFAIDRIDSWPKCEFFPASKVARLAARHQARSRLLFLAFLLSLPAYAAGKILSLPAALGKR